MRDWLDQRFGDRVRYGEPLKRHTSFRIGGPADAWIEVSSAAEILALQRAAAESAAPLSVLGIGTNVLVCDRGVRGIVIKLGRPLARIEWDPAGARVHVRAGAAAPFKKLVLAAAARQLEPASSSARAFPGSLGGGLLMNAGAFGGEIGQCRDGHWRRVTPGRGEQILSRAELALRLPAFDLPGRLIVTRVAFALTPGDATAIHARWLSASDSRERTNRSAGRTPDRSSRTRRANSPDG